MRIRSVVTCCVAGVALVWPVACSGDDEADRPGDPEVYERIDSLTDCAELQDEFDVAAANNDRAEAGTDQFDWTLAYMKAAQVRIEELDC